MSKPTGASPISSRRARALAQSLVGWYRDHARDLPWRRTEDPYAIWVSEVMLQQTRVETVVGRYLRFLRRFPTVEALASAAMADVVAEWAGLGYYRRARQLHAAARSVVENEGGKLPGSAAALRLLPGFGAYTAGAVASIAFQEPVPAVDGNVERVLSRLLAIEESLAARPTKDRIRAAATSLVKVAPPSVLNQALMELGATVCTPRTPRCPACPWASRCEARRRGVPESFPRRAPRPSPLDVVAYAAVARRGPRYLWRRRPEGVHNAGLWELPTTPWHGGPVDPHRARASLGELAEELHVAWTVGEPVATVRHGITRHRVTVVGYAVETRARRREGLQWASPGRAATLGLTAATGKLLRKLPTLL